MYIFNVCFVSGTSSSNGYLSSLKNSFSGSVPPLKWVNPIDFRSASSICCNSPYQESYSNSSHSYPLPNNYHLLLDEYALEENKDRFLADQRSLYEYFNSQHNQKLQQSAAHNSHTDKSEDFYDWEMVGAAQNGEQFSNYLCYPNEDLGPVYYNQIPGNGIDSTPRCHELNISGDADVCVADSLHSMPHWLRQSKLNPNAKEWTGKQSVKLNPEAKEWFPRGDDNTAKKGESRDKSGTNKQKRFAIEGRLSFDDKKNVPVFEEIKSLCSDDDEDVVDGFPLVEATKGNGLTGQISMMETEVKCQEPVLKEEILTACCYMPTETEISNVPENKAIPFNYQIDVCITGINLNSSELNEDINDLVDNIDDIDSNDSDSDSDSDIIFGDGDSECGASDILFEDSDDGIVFGLDSCYGSTSMLESDDDIVFGAANDSDTESELLQYSRNTSCSPSVSIGVIVTPPTDTLSPCSFVNVCELSDEESSAEDDEDIDWDCVSGSSAQSGSISEQDWAFGLCVNKRSSIGCQSKLLIYVEKERKNSLTAVEKANLRWDTEVETNIAVHSVSKVTFSDDVEINYVDADIERVGEWEIFARNSMRFRNRVEKLSSTLNPILDQLHRKRMFDDRFTENSA